MKTLSSSSEITPSGAFIARPSLINALLTIAGRDAQRFVSDRMRLLGSLFLPVLLIGGMGGIMQDNLGGSLGYNLVTFSVIGTFAMTMFTATVEGVASLVEDRDNDFGQELFIAPISPYAIILGKILGQSVVALLQGAVILVISVLAFGVQLSWSLILLLIPVALLICLLGGAFSALLTSLMSNLRGATQIVNLIIMPQMFLAGVFIPVKVLPWYLEIFSLLSPLRYIVDFIRALFYAGQPTYSLVVLESPWLDLLVMVVMFVVCFVAGTILFVRHERNR
jgi:ABC-2 type transport system permease protein